MEDYNNILYKLSKSKFRSSFHLNNKMKEYVNAKGMDVISEHAFNLISKRIGGCDIQNDGKQTPYKGHPVFIAQHATGTCCRGCLYKWHHIPQNRCLTEEEIKYIVNLITIWINREIDTK